MNPKKPKVKSAFKRSTGAPKKGYKWKETTSGRIPDPEVVPVKNEVAKLKPMRTVSSGSYGSGTPRKTVKNKSRSL
jgi:hypothetical protein